MCTTLVCVGNELKIKVGGEALSASDLTFQSIDAFIKNFTCRNTHLPKTLKNLSVLLKLPTFMNYSKYATQRQCRQFLCIVLYAKTIALAAHKGNRDDSIACMDAFSTNFMSNCSIVTDVIYIYIYIFWILLSFTLCFVLIKRPISRIWYNYW